MNLKGNKNMINILDKKDFYRAVLKGRLPVAKAIFALGRGEGGRLEFFHTPLGTILRATFEHDADLREVKMYDRSGGRFALQNVFCGDNLTKISEFEFVGVSSRLQIEDVIGSDFLIKCDDLNIIVKAQMISKPTVDKHAHLVYN